MARDPRSTAQRNIKAGRKHLGWVSHHLGSLGTLELEYPNYVEEGIRAAAVGLELIDDILAGILLGISPRSDCEATQGAYLEAIYQIERGQGQA